ncbi:MAG: hypothetical protein HYR81_04370 [Nitrospirae bacterium]|nr:hypothetical protein [Nitrospirota bacterium]
MDLLHKIINCKNIECKSNSKHPCHKIVDSQKKQPFHVPEPWNGKLESAPILFISSNPSITPLEDYPCENKKWDTESISDFFYNRFNGVNEAEKPWVENGLYPLLTDGTYRKAYSRFWASVRCRAAELKGISKEKIQPGIDYAISEVVHCKSKDEKGVKAALDECSNRYLEQIIARSGAKVIVCLGVPASQSVRKQICPKNSSTLYYGPVKIGKRMRHFVFLPHPNARKSKTFVKCLSRQKREHLRRVLRKDIE